MYSVNGNNISFFNLGSTEMYCADESINIDEQHMMTALNNITNFKIKDNTISFFKRKTKIFSATKTTENKMAQDDLKVEYTATTRGFYTQVIIKNKTISIQKDREGKTPATIRECTVEELNRLNTLLKATDLSKLQKYEGPTKKRHFDGAAHATLEITTKDGKTYTTPTFDHGHPNSNIEDLINTIANMAEMPK